YAYLNMRAAEYTERAIAIYKNLLVEHQDALAIYYRMGQGFNQLGKHEDAIEILQKGMQLQAPPQSEWHGATWLKAALPRTLAFAVWRASQSIEDTEGRLARLLDAYKLAQESAAAAEAGSD